MAGITLDQLASIFNVSGDKLDALRMILGQSGSAKPTRQPMRPNTLPPGLELPLAFGSGQAGMAAGGLAGLATLPFGGVDKAADVSQRIQNAMQYIPRDPRSTAALDRVAAVMDPLERSKRFLGENVQDAGYGPGVATAAHMLPDLALAALPFGRLSNLAKGRAAVAGSREAQIGMAGRRPPKAPPEVPAEPVAPAPTDVPAAAAPVVSAEGLNQAARSRRVVGTTGQYVGAPPGIDSPAKFNNLINQYAARIDDAIAAGVKPGYFYEKGSAANRQVTSSPAALAKLALIEGVTSSEAPVLTNTGWGIRAIEQNAMGAPIYAGKYPNAMRDKIERVLRGDFSHIGEKTHRYAGGLAGDEAGLAPNDRWEIRSMGYPGDTAGTAQHAFMDEVRQRAVDRWNARNPDKTPLTILNGQELNWAVQRARDLGTSVAEGADDVVHGALGAHTIQHSWESRGGAAAGHLQDMPVSDLPAYHGEVTDILLDPQGKDRLVTGMGGELQFPAVHGPGVFQGQISPGTQSRSLGYMTIDRGLDPTTQARVNATEMARAWMLGQDATGYHGVLRPKNLSGAKTDIFDLNIGDTITPDQALYAQQALDAKFGAGNTGVVPTASGYRVLRFAPNKKFAKGFLEDLAPDLVPPSVGPFQPGMEQARPDVRPGMRVGDSTDLGWKKQTATEEMLAAMNNPAAPKLADLFNSPEVRGLAGQIADLYGQKSAAGLTTNPRLPNALREFSTGGIPALEDLIRKGLAPSFGAAGLYGLFGPDASGQQGYQ